MVDVQQREALARKFHSEGYNCSQSVVMAYADVCGIDLETAARLSFPFGGGLSGLREVCGCVTGAAVVSSFVRPYDAQNPMSAAESRAFVKNIANRFKEENGDVVCRRLLGIEPGCPKPKKPCSDYVGYVARLIGEELNSAE